MLRRRGAAPRLHPTAIATLATLTTLATRATLATLAKLATPSRLAPCLAAFIGPLSIGRARKACERTL